MDEDTYSIFIFQDKRDVVFMPPDSYIVKNDDETTYCYWPVGCRTSTEFDVKVRRNKAPDKSWKLYPGKLYREKLSLAVAKKKLLSAKAQLKAAIARKEGLSEVGLSEAEQQKGRGARTKRAKVSYSPLSSSSSNMRRKPLPAPPDQEEPSSDVGEANSVSDEETEEVPAKSPKKQSQPLPGNKTLHNLSKSCAALSGTFKKNFEMTLPLLSPGNSSKSNENVDHELESSPIIIKKKTLMGTPNHSPKKNAPITSPTKKFVNSPSGKFSVGPKRKTSSLVYPLELGVFQKAVLEALARIEELLQDKDTFTPKKRSQNNADLLTSGFEFPLRNRDEFMKMEKFLQETVKRENFENILVRRLKTLGVSGSNDVEYLENTLSVKLMPWLFSNNLIMNSSKCGQRGSLGMKGTSFLKALGNACRRLKVFLKTVSDEDVLSVVGDFLRRKGALIRHHEKKMVPAKEEKKDSSGLGQQKKLIENSSVNKVKRKLQDHDQAVSPKKAKTSEISQVSPSRLHQSKISQLRPQRVKNYKDPEIDSDKEEIDLILSDADEDFELPESEKEADDDDSEALISDSDVI